MKKHIPTLACCLIVLVAGSTVFAQKTAEDYYKLSQKRMMARDVDGALKAINKAIELKPDVAGLYPTRSEIHMIRGEFEEAMADLDKALLLDSEMTEAYAARAHLLMMRGDMKGVLSDLDNAIARGDKSDRNYGMRANAKIMLGDPAGALRDFNTAISMNGNRVGNYIGRASARRMTGDEAGELADLTYVIDEFERHERAGTAPDQATRQMRGNDMVSPVINGPEHTKPGDSKVVTKTQMVVTINPEAEATMTAEEMEYLPNVAGAYMNRAQIYSKKGDLDAALADLNKSLEVYPYSGAYGVRGRVLQQRGDLSAALADFSKQIELQPQMAYSYLERAEVLMLLRKDEEAEKDFSRALKLDPSMEIMVANRRAAVKKQKQEHPK